MAERVKVFEDEQGNLIARLPGSDQFIPITEDDLATLEEGNFSAFWRSADNAIQQAGTGARALIAGALGAEETEAQAMEKLGGLRAEQELRAGENPVVSFGGSVAPDVALGAMTGGAATVGRRVAGTALMEGALGAARNPEAPVMGALVQGGLGAATMGAAPVAGAIGRRVHPFTARVQSGVRGAIERTRGVADDAPGIYRSSSGATGLEGGRLGQMIDDAPDPYFSRVGGDDALPGGQGPETGPRPAGAQINAAGDPQNLGQMGGSGFLTPDEMVEEFGFPMSANQAEMSRAWANGEERAFQAARQGDVEEELRSRTGSVLSRLWKGQPTDYGGLKQAQRATVREWTAAEIGMPQLKTIDRNAVGENLERISSDIGKIIQQSGPVRTEPIKAQWQALLERRPNGPAADQVRGWIKEIEDMPRHADPREIGNLRNEISKAMEWAGETKPEPRAVETMGAAREMLDQELKKKWTPDMQQEFETLGYQWKLSQALVRGAKGAMNERGDINLGTFMNNWRMLDHMVKTGRSRDNRFLQFMQQAGMMMMKEAPDSGTPAGIAAGLAAMGEDAILNRLGPLGSVLR